jgi:hypothetical protein
MGESAEVARLRARIAELELRLEATEPSVTAEEPPVTETVRTHRAPGRVTASAVLLILGCLLAPLSVTAVWASAELSDTDRYVETVAPLADDPAVRSAVANQVTASVLDSLEVEDLTTQLLDTLAAQENVPPRVAAALPALAVPISDGVESFTRTQIRNIMATPQFAQVWEQVNRVAHTQVVRLLEGTQGGAVSAQGDTITLNLAPIIEQVKARLVAQGFTLAENIPVVDRSFVLVQSDAIASAQSFYSLLNTLGAWLSVVALLLFAAGLFLARDHRRALLRGALGVTAAMVVVGAGLAIFRTVYVESTPAGILTPDAAGSVFDTLVRFLRTGLRAVAVLGLVVALAAFVAGPSTAAARTRSSLRGGFAFLRGSAESAGWNAGRVGTWAFAHKRGLQVGVLAAAGLTLMFWTAPTVGTVVFVTLVVLLFLAVVEFLARPPAAVVADAGTPATEAAAEAPAMTATAGPVLPSPRTPVGGTPRREDTKQPAPPA